MDSWWERFFEGDWLDLQPAAWSAEHTAADVDAIVRLLALKTGAKVLDVPCGEGRISLELARRRFDVTSLDLSEPLLELGRTAASEEELNISWHLGDMRELPWADTFDAAVCWWGSFGYFDDQGNQQFLSAVAQALKPGGHLIIDSPRLEWMLPNWQARDWFKIGDAVVLENRRYEPASGRVEGEWTIIRDGRQSVRHSSIRLYSLRELIELAQDAGFSEVRGIERETGEDYEYGSPGRLAIATR